MLTMRRALHLPFLSLGSFGLIFLLDAALVLRPSSSWPLSSSSGRRRETPPPRISRPNGGGGDRAGRLAGRRMPPFVVSRAHPQLRRDVSAVSDRRRRPRSMQMTPSDGAGEEDYDDGRVHFDDFGGRVIGGGGGGEQAGDEAPGGRRRRSSSASSESASSLLSSQLRAAVEQHESRRLENWQKGNWHVRGISLDPDSAASAEAAEYDGTSAPHQKVHVCMVAADPTSPSRVWVGRTDGSLLAVQMGDDFMTRFRSQLSATYNDSAGTAQVSVRLVNDNDDDSSLPTRGDDDNDDEVSVRSGAGGSSASPFELHYQGSVGSSPVSCVFIANDETMYSACRDSGDIQQWVVEELDEERLQLVRRATLSGAHGAGSTVLMLKGVRLAKGTGLVSVARDGSVGLWDAGSGALRSRFQIEADDDPDRQAAFVHAADGDGTNLFVGTARGQVLAYSLRDVLDGERATTAPPPNGQWTASVDHAVTAIACGGPGSLGTGGTSAQPTATLFTGDGAGTVKQWEVLTRPGPADDGDSATAGTRLEPWPRLPTQRLQKRAHVFESSHTDAVTALLPVDSHKVLSASRDGSVVAWNPATGRSYFFMDGFEKDIRSLCVQENTLVTDGMKHLVCVHDFDVEADIPDDDDWDRFEVDR